jgi:hypothetical protein
VHRLTILRCSVLVVKSQPWLAPLLQVATEYIKITIAVEHPIECFLGFRGFFRVHFDIVPTIDTATRVIHPFRFAPDLDYFTRDGIAFRSDAAMAGAQVRVVDVHLAERTMDAEFLLHDISPISEKINTTAGTKKPHPHM